MWLLVILFFTPNFNSEGVWLKAYSTQTIATEQQCQQLAMQINRLTYTTDLIAYCAPEGDQT